MQLIDSAFPVYIKFAHIENLDIKKNKINHTHRKHFSGNHCFAFLLFNPIPGSRIFPLFCCIHMNMKNPKWNIMWKTVGKINPKSHYRRM